MFSALKPRGSYQILGINVRFKRTNGEFRVARRVLEQYKHVVLPNSSEFWSISADVNTELQSGGAGRRDGHNPGQKRRKNRWKVEFSPVNTTVPVRTRAHAHTLQKKFVFAVVERKNCDAPWSF